MSWGTFRTSYIVDELKGIPTFDKEPNKSHPATLFLFAG